jgi:hypothetical protein
MSEDAFILARIAGLDLPAEFHDDLLVAWDKLQAILSRMPRRERGDEPAHVFLPERFMPPA